MDLINKVLLATDFSDTSENALDHAALIAAKNDAELHVVHVRGVSEEVDQGDFPDYERFQQALDAVAQKQLQAVRPKLTVPMVRQVLQHKRPELAIIDYAKQHGMDLVVLGTHGRSGLPRLFLGSVAERLVRLSPVSALVVGQGDAHRLREAGYSIILVPIDFSEHSTMALKQARALAKQHQAKLVLVHAIESVTYPGVYAPPGGYLPLEGQSQMEEKAHAALQRMVADFEGEADVKIRLGNAAHLVSHTAEELSADLIVMSTAGLSGVDHLVLGSVTEKTLRRSPCPVLVAKTAHGLNV